MVQLPFLSRKCTQTMSRLAALQVLIVLFTPGLVLASDVADRLKAANRAAIEAVQTCSASFQISYEPPGPAPFKESGQFCALADMLRVHYESNYGVYDSLIKDSTVKTISMPPSKDRLQAEGITDAYDGGIFPGRDPWHLALFAFLNPAEKKWMSIDRLLESPKLKSRVSKETEGGQEFIVATIDHGRYHETGWFDPRVNFLARKYVLVQDRDDTNPYAFRYEYDVKKFVEPNPGTFFPEELEHRSFTNGKFVSMHRTVFSDIHINQPLVPERFDFQFPEGMTITDKILRKTYKVDARGNPVGKMSDLTLVLGPAEHHRPISGRHD